jgi:hypothetical protein
MGRDRHVGDAEQTAASWNVAYASRDLSLDEWDGVTPIEGFARNQPPHGEIKCGTQS